MKKLHSFTFYALITPVLTFGAGSVLAQQPSEFDNDSQLESTQRNQGEMNSSPMAIQGNQSSQSGQSGMKHRGYMDSLPMNGAHASNLIGADVKTAKDEEVGEVNDLIIDDKGQVVAIVVGVGGFLGMGEKDVAIGWDDVTRSGLFEDTELQIKSSREDLTSAPAFKRAD